jgi:hypothetical protein
MAGNRALVRHAAAHGRDPGGLRERSLQQNHSEQAEECH